MSALAVAGPEERMVLVDLPSDRSLLAVARAAFRAFVAALADSRLASREVDEIEVVLQEALTNVVRHAHGGDARRRGSVAFRRLPDGIEIVVRDTGAPFELPVIDPDPEALREGGYGIHIMRSWMDDVRLVREADGNALHLLRRFRPAPGAAAPPASPAAADPGTPAASWKSHESTQEAAHDGSFEAPTEAIGPLAADDLARFFDGVADPFDDHGDHPVAQPVTEETHAGEPVPPTAPITAPITAEDVAGTIGSRDAEPARDTSSIGPKVGPTAGPTAAPTAAPSVLGTEAPGTEAPVTGSPATGSPSTTAPVTVSVPRVVPPGTPSLPRELLVRGGAEELLRRLHGATGAEVAVFDAAGHAVCGSGRLTECRPRVNGGGAISVAGPVGAVVPVLVFEKLAGFVAVGHGDALRGDGARSAADAIADRAAADLAERVAREYELDDLSREILTAYEELSLFHELNAELSGTRDPAAVCATVLSRAVRVIPAERAWILVEDGVKGLLRPAASIRPPEGIGEIPGNRGAAGRSLLSRLAELTDDPSGLTAEDRPHAGWETSARVGLLTVPLLVPGRDGRRPLGVLQLADRRGGDAFTAGDLKLATALASHAAVQIENQRLVGYEREMQIARQIQQRLLPAAPPRIPGLDVAGACLAASSVGGDYYDHVTAPTGRLSLLVADVSGHDLAAALLQTAARTALRAEILAGHAPGEVLARVNRVLADDLTRSDLFLTAWAGDVDPATGRVVFSGAGHPAALVYRAATGAVEEAPSGGPPVGVLEETTYEEGAVVLEPGDVLVAFTDGLTEVRSPVDRRELGPEGLAAALRTAAAGSAASVVRALLAAAARHDGGAAASDDRSLLVVKRTPPDSR